MYYGGFVTILIEPKRSNRDLRVNMYADDCLIYTIGNDWELMVPKMQAGLNSFQQSLHEN